MEDIKMKIVVLSGSPHKKGTTSKLADRFIEGAKSVGNEIVRFDTAFMNIHPCIACEKCHSSENAACAFADDMVEIGKELATSDVIAMVTPIYYYGVCTQLKVVIDRFYAIESKIRKNQKAVLITAMADDRPETIIPTNDWYKAAIEWMEWKDAGIVNALGCTTVDDLNGKEDEKMAYDLGASLK